MAERRIRYASGLPGVIVHGSGCACYRCDPSCPPRLVRQLSEIDRRAAERNAAERAKDDKRQGNRP